MSSASEASRASASPSASATGAAGHFGKWGVQKSAEDRLLIGCVDAKYAAAFGMMGAAVAGFVV